MSKISISMEELKKESENPREYTGPDELAYFDKSEHLACSIVHQPEHCHCRKVKQLLKRHGKIEVDSS